MREYDLYERGADGSLYWHGFARGVENTRSRLQRLSLETGHECFGIYGPTKEVIRADSPAAKG